MRSKFRTLIAIVIVVLITILTHYLGWLHPAERFVRRLIAPGSDALYSWSVTLDDQTELFHSVGDLERAYTMLKQTYLENKIDETRFALLEEENTSLRKGLDFVQKTGFKTLGADVIGKQIDPIGSTIILNRGTKDGIKDGMPVIVHDGILIGSIARAEEDMSIVRLITDNQSRVAATLMNKEKSIGLIEGGFGLSVRMTFVPQHELISVGDVVITSGLEKEMPYGLMIGVVESVEKEVYEPFQRAIITSPVNLQQLIVVSVLLESI